MISYLVNSNRNYSTALTDLGIPHVFEEYDGHHSDKVAERIETKLLPFFSENLLDTMITGSLSPELIQWQEIDAKENFSLKETINLDTTIWNSDSVSYKIISVKFRKPVFYRQYEPCYLSRYHDD